MPSIRVTGEDGIERVYSSLEEVPEQYRSEIEAAMKKMGAFGEEGEIRYSKMSLNSGGMSEGLAARLRAHVAQRNGAALPDDLRAELEREVRQTEGLEKSRLTKNLFPAPFSNQSTEVTTTKRTAIALLLLAIAIGVYYIFTMLPRN